MVILIIYNSIQKDPDIRLDIDELLKQDWLKWFMYDDLSVQIWMQETFLV